MLSKATNQPREGVLRTPEACFDGIRDYPWEPRYFEVEPGLRMAYVDAGPSDATETLLLLHGEPMWSYLYRKMIPSFEKAGFRVIAPDLIGFGRSDKPIAPEAYTYSHHVKWVTSLIDHLDLQDITIFGQDWGGLIGGRVAAESEARFARAVFSNTALPGSGRLNVPGLSAQGILSPDTLKALTGLDWRDTVNADDSINPDKVYALVRPGPANYFLSWRVYSQEVETLLPSRIVPGWCLKPVSKEALRAYDAPFPTQEFTAGVRRFPLLVPITSDDPEQAKNDAAWKILEEWRKPVLTVWGDYCPHSRMDMGRSYQTRIPGAQLPGIDHKVFAASHFIQEDMGEEVAVEMIKFIEQFSP